MDIDGDDDDLFEQLLQPDQVRGLCSPLELLYSVAPLRPC